MPVHPSILLIHFFDFDLLTVKISGHTAIGSFTSHVIDASTLTLKKMTVRI